MESKTDTIYFKICDNCGNDKFYHRYTNWIQCIECSQIKVLKDENRNYDRRS